MQSIAYIYTTPLQSNPSIPPILVDWRKSSGIPKTAVLGVIYNIQNPYLGLENGRRYWEGGGIGMGGIEGDDCTKSQNVCIRVGTEKGQQTLKTFVNSTLLLMDSLCDWDPLSNCTPLPTRKSKNRNIGRIKYKWKAWEGQLVLERVIVSLVVEMTLIPDLILTLFNELNRSELKHKEISRRLLYNGHGSWRYHCFRHKTTPKCAIHRTTPKCAIWSLKTTREVNILEYFLF